MRRSWGFTLETKRYKILTFAVMEVLEDYGVTYAEAFETLEGVKRQLEHRIESIKIDPITEEF